MPKITLELDLTKAPAVEDGERAVNVIIADDNGVTLAVGRVGIIPTGSDEHDATHAILALHADIVGAAELDDEPLDIDAGRERLERWMADDANGKP